MAEVLPFRGWRYDTNLVDPALVTAPPYDVIGEEGREFYHRRHPENVIRLILGREEPGDDESNNKYTRAHEHLDDWRRRGVLRRDVEPAFYIYRQDFTPPGGVPSSRTGLIADLRLTPYAEGVVRPHERTLSRPKQDRLSLMRATGFQLSQVFMLYEDPGAAIAPLLHEAVAKTPGLDLVDPEGVRHRLWTSTDPGAAGRIRAFFAPRPVYIADGHHRYETALAYRDELLAAGRRLGEADKVAVALLDMDQPGLVVFPTHRAVHSLPAWDGERFRLALAENFKLSPFAGGPPALAAAIQPVPHSFGFIFPDGAYMATLTDEDRALAAMPRARALEWRRLDVSLLHGLIFGRALGLSEDAQARQENLIYTRDPAEVAAMVASGRAQFGVLLRPTSVREMKAVADAGEAMPQKSTYFWPKLLSGLVFKEL